MTTIELLLSHPVVLRLGWALVHFVWQGAALALLLVLVLAWLHNRHAQSRYVAACAALLVMAILPVATFFAVPDTQPTRAKGTPRIATVESEDTAQDVPLPAPLPVNLLSTAADERPARSESPSAPSKASRTTRYPGQLTQPVETAPISWSQQVLGLLDPFLPWVVLLWFIGVVVLSLRLLGGWTRVRRLTHLLTTPATERWQRIFRNLARRLALRRPVRLLESVVAEVPTAIGWLRPVILLPASALTGLTPPEIEAIIAHELAHVRRYDYLVNLVQSTIETLLFYHPAVWWVGRQIRVEREHCCDDLAVSVCADRLTYVQALARMEEIRSVPPQPALAAGGGALLPRIRRLLGVVPRKERGMPQWVAGLLAMVALVGLIAPVYMSWQVSAEAGAAEPAASENRASAIAESAMVALPWQRHVVESERRIEAAADAQSYEDAALLGERLLGDYDRATTYLLQRWDQVKTTKLKYPRWSVARQLARCSAHRGNFGEAQAWLARAKEIDADRDYDDLEKEIARCRTWIPQRDASKRKYDGDLSVENARVLLHAYDQLGEYASMKRLVEEMQGRFAGNPLLASQEFQAIRNFAEGYVILLPPTTESQAPATVPARDPKIETVFQKLHAIWDAKSSFAQTEWSQMTTIEKAKFINLYWSQLPRKGFQWEPTESEAADFLREMGLSGLGDAREQKMLDQVFREVRSRMTKEEANRFDNDEKARIETLISMGRPAIGDLMAKIQQAPWDSRAGRESLWAGQALSGMGDPAVPALSEAIERILDRDPVSFNQEWQKFRTLVQSLAVTTSPNAVPTLRRVVDCHDRHAREPAIDGLAKIKGGLTQDMFLNLWEDGDDYIRGMAARLLGERGDKKAIAILERDIPTAYAEARYQAEQAVWEIKSRLKMDAGRQPEPVRHTKDNPAPLWEGIERSLESPNRGIRITAISRLELQARDSQSIEPLIRAMRNNPDKDVRAQAARSLASAFSRSVEATTDPEQLAAAFDLLSDAIAEGDEDRAMEAMQAAHAFRRFKDRPGFNRVVTRVLDGMDSSNTMFRAECMYVFVRLFYSDRELMNRYVTPARRQSLSKAVLAGLKSDYGRFKVDAQDAAKMLDLREAVSTLIEWVKTEPKGYLRSYAADALGEIGDARAIPALEQMACSDPFVDSNGFRANRAVAWQAIRDIRDRTAKR